MDGSFFAAHGKKKGKKIITKVVDKRVGMPYSEEGRRLTTNERGIADMEDKIQLTDAEWKIMLVLWQRGPQTIMALTHALEAETGWTKHTVIALLRRMVTKETVRLEEQGRAKLVHPLVSKEQVANQQTQTLLSRLFDGRISLLIAEMVAQKEVSPDELEAMLHIIREEQAKEDES